LGRYGELLIIEPGDLFRLLKAVTLSHQGRGPNPPMHEHQGPRRISPPGPLVARAGSIRTFTHRGCTPHPLVEFELSLLTTMD
jgi:hypothetical protein